MYNLWQQNDIAPCKNQKAMKTAGDSHRPGPDAQATTFPSPKIPGQSWQPNLMRSVFSFQAEKPGAGPDDNHVFTRGRGAKKEEALMHDFEPKKGR